MKIAAVTFLSVLASGAAAPKLPKMTQFTRGTAEFSAMGNPLKIELSKMAGASHLMPAGTSSMLGLAYGQPGFDSPKFRFALTGVKGPGSYGNKNIGNIVVQPNADTVWNFDAGTDSCTFTFAKLDDSGVEGSLRCSSKQELVTSEVRFKAER